MAAAVSHSFQGAALDGLAQLKKQLESSVKVKELPKGGTTPNSYKSLTATRYFQVSPYVEQPHLLDMTSVSGECQLLARALVEMQAVRDDYATAAYTEAFNWPRVYERLQELVSSEKNFEWAEEQCFYIVVFRSLLSPETDRSFLGALDKASHAEASEGGGLLKYWFGTPDENGRNMATCLWRRQEDAKCGGNGPSHKQAARQTRNLYQEWHIERLRLTVGPHASSWTISKW